MTDNPTNHTTKQVVSDTWTAVLLVSGMVGIGYGLWSLTGWDLSIWWRALILLILSYLATSIFMLGVNAFVKLSYQEYQKLSP